MTLAAMRDEAIELVSLYTEADCKPDISAEVPQIVERHKRCDIWAATTAYSYGDRVQLPTRNGHRYRCLTAGTSAATQDAFPAARFADRPQHRVTDGTVLWVEEGEDYDNVYDIRGSAHEGWMVKAGKATHLTDVALNGRNIAASQLQAQCRQRAMEYAPVEFA